MLWRRSCWLDERQTLGTNSTFHILHPQPTPWRLLLLTVKGVLDRAAADKGRSPIEVIPYHEWVSRLEARCSMETINAEAFAANPAMKLLTCFKSSLSDEGRIGTFELKQSMAASDTMRSLNLMIWTAWKLGLRAGSLKQISFSCFLSSNKVFARKIKQVTERIRACKVAAWLLCSGESRDRYDRTDFS